MAKEKVAADAPQAGVSVTLPRPTFTKGLGSKGTRRGMEGVVTVEWTRVPANVIGFLLDMGADRELGNASQAADRAETKAKIEFAKAHGFNAEGVKAEFREEEADKFLAARELSPPAFDLRGEALKAMGEHVEKWYSGDVGRELPLDPVRARGLRIAVQLVQNKAKTDPEFANLSGEQVQEMARAYLDGPKGPVILKKAAEQIASEAAAAQRAVDELAGLDV